MSRNTYPDDLPAREALQLYFSKYHFENGGYDLKWFKIKFGPVFLPLPNIKDRVDAVKIHDLHHLVTEYPATLKGEAEIGAWELASGCGRYYAAWILNAGGFFYGMFCFPQAVLQAFLRGRKAQNLYYNTVYNEALLNRTVGDLRRHTEAGQSRKSSITDYLLFVLCCLVILTSAYFFFYGCYLLLRLLF